MKKVVLLLPLIIVPLLVLSQVYDCFDDGDFSSDPTWHGSTSSFIVSEDNMLQLFAVEAGTAYLYTANALVDTVEWCFRIKLAFSPSQNNYAEVWLACNTLSAGGAANGLFLKFGESGSKDAIELYAIVDSIPIRILRGTESLIASPFVRDVKVTRCNNQWKLYSKTPEDTFFSPEAAAIYDDYHLSTRFFGVLCKYTQSNTSKFLFDDFIVRQLTVDTIPPHVEEIYMRSPNSISVRFSEPVRFDEDEYNYFLNNAFIYPEDAVVVDKNKATVKLLFSSEIPDNMHEILCVANISDYEGNTMKDTCVNFVMTHIYTGDILINEFMFDVNPAPNGVPPYDYLELFNRTGVKTDITDWLLDVDGELFFSSFKPPVIIDTFLVFSSVPFGDELPGTVLFSSFNLLNGGRLTLYDSDEKEIDAVNYDSSWINDEEKGKGGWSLERISSERQPDDFPVEYNWHVCVDTSGGTPCRTNSVDTIMVIIGDSIEKGDIVVNEILANAGDYVEDFVEIINISDKNIDLSFMDFLVYKNGRKTKYRIAEKNKIITPSEIVLLTSDTVGISSQYPFHSMRSCHIMKSFPNLNGEEGIIGLADKTGAVVVDSLFYSGNMHVSLLREKKDISLERISPYRSSTDATNWHSAAETYNYGSPGVVNSQYMEFDCEQDGRPVMNISPRVCSPDNDGVDDVVSICFSSEISEYVVSVDVYSRQGLAVRSLVVKGVLPPAECVLWDGTDDEGMVVPVGVYIVSLTYYDDKGIAGREKGVISIICK